MIRTFHAKIDPILLVGCLLPSTVLAVVFFWIKQPIPALIFLVLMVLIVERLIHTSYVLTDDGVLLGGVSDFRMKGNLDSMVFVSDQASCLNEQQLADFGNQDFEVRRMRYEIRGDGRITGVQTQKAWKEIKERDAEDVSVSFADYLSLFLPFGDRDDVKNLFSLESRKKASAAGGGTSSASEEPLSVGYVRRFIPDGIDPTCEKRTIGWYPLYTFRSGKYVVCSLYKFGDVPKSYNYPNREGLLVVYTPEGKIVDACPLAREGDLWSYYIPQGTVRPFCLQVRQNVPTNSESSHNSVVSEYTLDQNGHIQVCLIRAD